jgi:hypothetical protein
MMRLEQMSLGGGMRTVCGTLAKAILAMVLGALVQAQDTVGSDSCYTWLELLAAEIAINRDQMVMLVVGDASVQPSCGPCPVLCVEWGGGYVDAGCYRACSILCAAAPKGKPACLAACNVACYVGRYCARYEYAEGCSGSAPNMC